MLSSVQNPRLFLLQCRLSHLHFPSKPIKATLHTSQSLTLSSSSSSPTPPTSQILTIRKSLLSREKTAVELAQDYLTRLRRSEPQLKSFLYVSEDSVLRDAQEIDKKIERNEGIGPLAGVFVGVKDNICTVDMPATAGSKILENYRPAYDATAVSKMREKGAIIVGKTNLDEFGMGSTTEGSAYQVTANPWDLSRVPAYYILASSESSSNLSRYDGIRYGNHSISEELNSLYGNVRAHGFGSEVKRRILMGTYALSAGYYDAYYKRAQQVRTLVQKSFKAALHENDILISPAAPSAAYKIGEKKNDPLAMYAGDIMTVNVNLAGLPALVLPCGFVEGGPAGLPVGFQMIGAAFDEEKLLKVGHIFEQTLQDCCFVPPLVADSLAC